MWRHDRGGERRGCSWCSYSERRNGGRGWIEGGKEMLEGTMVAARAYMGNGKGEVTVVADVAAARL